MKGRVVTAAAVLSATLITSAFLMQRSSSARHGSGEQAKLFEDVLQHLRNDYVDTLSDSALYRRAVDGVLKELHDPHTMFLDPTHLTRFAENTQGEYAGLGIQMDMRDSGVTVIGTLPNTPAERAGMLTGDRVVSVDGKSTAGLTAEEAQKLMRGGEGTSVKIVVTRAGVAERLTFSLTRQKIEVNPVRYALIVADSVGYVDLTVFSAKAGEDVRVAVDSLRHAGARSLVMDLRGDPGGLLDQGVGVADLFLNTGQPIVSIKGRRPEENQTFADRAPQLWPDMPLVILTDSATASASEIVAGALQDHDRALLIGTTTYGKGSAQRLFPVNELGAVKMTTALWFTPSGRSINKRVALPNEADDNDTGAPKASDTLSRPRFKTTTGRTVLGGGGIVPDITVAKRVATPADKALQAEIGAKLPKFRDAVSEYAVSLRTAKAITDPAFVVTPTMRDELFRRLQQRGITISRAAYEADSSLVTRAITGAVARFVFGPRVEFSRALRDDATMLRALDMLRGVRTQAELLAKSPASTQGTRS